MAQKKEEKAKTLAEVMNEINKINGENTIGYLPKMKNVEVERIPSGSIWLDYCLGGGWPVGRLVEIYGAFSSGKSLISQKTIAEAQKLGKKCCYIDCESTLDPMFAQKLGVNIDDMILAQSVTGEKTIDMILALISADIDLIVVDSVAALIPGSELSDPMEQQTIGLHARMMSKACVAYDEKVFLPMNGNFKRMCDLKKGDIILSHKNNKIIKQRIRDVFHSGKKMVYKINNRTRLTEDHLVLTCAGYKEVKDLTKNDTLILQGQHNYFGKKTIDVQLAKLVGYLIGDGCISNKHGLGTFTNIDDEILKNVSDIANSFDCGLRQKTKKDYQFFKKCRNRANPLRKKLDDIGLKRVTSYDKEIPEIFFDAKKDSVIALLEGLFDTDGYVSTKRGSIGYASVSEKLVLQIGELLKRFGIFGTITERTSKSNFGKYWVIRITGRDNLELFANNLTLINRKQKNIINYLASKKCDGVSSKNWLPSCYIPLIKKSFPNGTRASRILGIKNRTGYPEWNKSGRDLLTKKHVEKLIREYPGYTNNAVLEKIISNGIIYEQIKTIKKEKITDVYDLTMAGSPNFIVNGMVVHNCRKITAVNKKTIIIFINQQREMVGAYSSYGTPTTTTGGRALGFYASIRVEVKRGEDIEENKARIGQMIKFKVQKNKTAAPFRNGYVRFIYNNEHNDHSFDTMDEIVSLGIITEKIQQRGAYFYYEDGSYRGRNGIEEALRKDDELFDRLRNDVLCKKITSTKNAKKKKAD